MLAMFSEQGLEIIQNVVLGNSSTRIERKWVFRVATYHGLRWRLEGDVHISEEQNGGGERKNVSGLIVVCHCHKAKTKRERRGDAGAPTCNTVKVES